MSMRRIVLLAASLAASVPADARQTPSPAPLPAEQEKREPEPMDKAFERLLESKEEAGITELMRARPYEVIGFVDGYLESWLAAQENPAESKGVDVARLMDLAQAAAKRADATFGVDAYSRYASAWKGWSAEQRLQFREGQKKFGAGREAMKQKDFATAQTAFADSLRLATPLGDAWGIAQAEQSLGDVAAARCTQAGTEETKKALIADAIAHHTRAAKVFGELRHPGVLRSLRALGKFHEEAGDLESARIALERMIEVANEARRADSAAPVKQDLARICRALGDEAAAKRWGG